MDLGPHAAYIWAAYAVVALVLAALVAWLVLDGRRQQRLVDELEAARRPAPVAASLAMMSHARALLPSTDPCPVRRRQIARARVAARDLRASWRRSSPSRCAAAIPPSCPPR